MEPERLLKNRFTITKSGAEGHVAPDEPQTSGREGWKGGGGEESVAGL